MLSDLFAYEFMAHAFWAGTCAAIAAAAIGWFVVLRREAFAAHTLSVVGFPGATFAVLLGWLPSFGRGETVALGWWSTGLLTWAGLAALKVPLALLSGLVCGVLTFVPTIGPTAACVKPMA